MAFLDAIKKKKKRDPATHIKYAEYLMPDGVKINYKLQKKNNTNTNIDDVKQQNNNQNNIIQGFDGKSYKVVKIIAISDTHMEHDKLNMPKGDILILSGDYTNHGTIEEAKIVNEWLGKIKIKCKYKHILLINGNHEGFGNIILSKPYLDVLQSKNRLIKDDNTVNVLYNLYMKQIEKLRKIMTNCTFLDDEEITIEGIKFYGTSWTNHTDINYGLYLEPKYIKQKWNNIPDDVDYLITHTGPQGIIDRINHSGCSQLRLRLNALTKLRVHQYGHVHGVSDYSFITKKSMIDSLKDEQTRAVHASNKPWFYLLDRMGKKLIKYKNFKIKLDVMKDCVLFMNAVNAGTEQPMWFYMPVPV